ncbi:hypothetical protein Dsin_022273 [Dipteronia sinensis]|uniref:Uncharacterized protein n=1 Tax=Dipteronia sinensis TaxID=43782 RepID=A0AAE0A1G0_9ROSI|nr:hypothetical protein Dsin_022273 [Dipteronia sinensis]
MLTSSDHIMSRDYGKYKRIRCNSRCPDVSKRLSINFSSRGSEDVNEKGTSFEPLIRNGFEDIFSGKDRSRNEDNNGTLFS